MPDKPTDEFERRYITTDVEIEERAGTTPLIKGRPIVFGQMSDDLGGFREIISADALREADMTDIVAVHNHDINILMGRANKDTSTLKFDVRSDGVYVEIDPVDSPIINGIVASIRRKDIKGMSFRFRVLEDNWVEEGDTIVRYVTKIKQIKDFSTVVYPAYPQTDVALRSLEEWRSKSQPPPPQPAGIPIELYRLKLQLNERKCQKRN